MGAIRSSSSALLLLGGVATLPGAASVRSRFPQRSPASPAAQAELGYMQQPLGPANIRTPPAAPQPTFKRSATALQTTSLGAAQVVTMTTIPTRPQTEKTSHPRPTSAREIVAVVLSRNHQYTLAGSRMQGMMPRPDKR
ncbi:hypothetical protein CPLU01_02322 [Colletotrichum plurivorum]|uniref:Uncharacterized protein n=1 Tax=Colletotrichum plurivorum TaxID=2175906 RepID=A0A8H6NME4_9PEZI|nr:hypothetical protein CPLU01_02322 [Colletotrichum plurivorum]